MVTPGMVTPTAYLAAADLEEIRALLDAAFDDFSEHDWDHSLGGLHTLVREGGGIVAHGSLVQRRLLVGERTLRCGYVEGVATHPDHRRRGHASRVMDTLESLAAGYDLLALSASEAGLEFYEQRGWTRWRGPSAVLGPRGLEPTPDDDGSILVLGGTGLDLDAPVACEWRDGDVW